MAERANLINRSLRNGIYIPHPGSSKNSGFQQATATSISLGIDDLLTIPSKGWLVQDSEQQSLILEKHHHFGNVHAELEEMHLKCTN
ncbi:hypothetical protein GQ457_16G016600 [Hibiscus cannabinus]